MAYLDQESERLCFQQVPAPLPVFVVVLMHCSYEIHVLLQVPQKVT